MDCETLRRKLFYKSPTQPTVLYPGFVYTVSLDLPLIERRRRYGFIGLLGWDVILKYFLMTATSCGSGCLPLPNWIYIYVQCDQRPAFPLYYADNARMNITATVHCKSYITTDHTCTTNIYIYIHSKPVATRYARGLPLWYINYYMHSVHTHLCVFLLCVRWEKKIEESSYWFKFRTLYVFPRCCC